VNDKSCKESEIATKDTVLHKRRRALSVFETVDRLLQISKICSKKKIWLYIDVRYAIWKLLEIKKNNIIWIENYCRPVAVILWCFPNAINIDVTLKSS